MKMKQRLLSVGGMPGAMESSLSVNEVAAQTSKPGVKTPSRAAGRGVSGGEGGVADESQGSGVRTAEESGRDGLGFCNDAVTNAANVPKSPFEVEGEA